MKTFERFLDKGNTLENKALSIFLSVVLVFSFINVSAFADNGENQAQDTATEQEAATETSSTEAQSTESEAPSATTDTAATATDTTATQQSNNSSNGTSSAAAPAASEEETHAVDESVIKVEGLENAYIEYPDGQYTDVRNPEFKTTANEQFKFKAHANTGFEITKVTLVNGSEQEVTADSDGYYTVSASKANGNLTIKVETKATETDSSTAQGENTTINEDTVINGDTTGTTEDADNAGTSEEEATDDADNTGTTEDEGTDEATEDTDNRSFFDKASDAISNFFFGTSTLSANIGSYSTSQTSLSMEVGDTATLKGTTSVTEGWSRYTTSNHQWTSSDSSVVSVAGTDGSATIAGKAAGTATITHTSEYSHWVNNGGWRYVTETVTDTWTVTVKAGVVATALELPETATVKRGDTTQIVPTVLEPSDASIAWTSSDTSIVTVDANGYITGVKPGTTTVIAKSGDLMAATTVTVTGNSSGSYVKGASFYYAVSPSAIVASNKTSNWAYLGWANSAVDLTGATWVQGDTSAKNTFDDVPNRMLAWPDGSTGSTYNVTKGSDTWNYIYKAWKSELESELGVSISEDDVVSIKLEPVKVSDNGGDSNYHVDCGVIVETKGVVMAKYYVQDAGGTEFVNQENYKYIANKGTTSPQGSYPETKTYNGHTYTFSGWYDNASCTGTPVAFPYSIGDSNVNFYAKYVRSDIQYTVNYYWNGTTEKVADSVTKAAGTPGTVVSETPATIDGYTAVSNAKKQIVVKEDGTNEINFYYYKNVDLTANSDTVTYDGTEHSVSGYTMTGADGTTTFDGIETPSAKGTDAGTYDATFADGTVGQVSTDEKFIVASATDGQLVINPVEAEVTITIKGNTGGEKYNGQKQTVEGYTFTSSNKLVKESDVTFTGNAAAEGTDAGTYAMGLAEDQFSLSESVAKNFKKVTINVEDGALTIAKRDVTLTSSSAEKTYDGTALTKNAATDIKVGGDGFVGQDNFLGINAEGATYDITGTQAEVGESANTFDYTLNSNTKAENYNINKVEGTLKVTPVADKVTVTIQENSGTATYDGTEHTVSGYTVKSIQINGQDTTLYAANDFTFSGNSTVTGTDAGTYNMELKASDFTNISKNFSDVEFVIEDGSLVVSPRDVTLTSGTKSKTYDGTALTDDTVTVSGAGFVEGEGASYDVTGTITNVGSVDNGFTYTLNSNTKAGNYNITTSEGTLTVTQDETEVVVTITENSGTVKYNGSEQSVTGYTVTNISNGLYSEDDFTFNGDATAKGTDAGTYDMDLKATNFTNNNKNFKNVTFVIVDGTLTIQKRDVTLTSATAEKVYDGKALTNDEVTVGGDGFVEGEGASYDVTGTITNVGSVDNGFDYTLNSNTKADNYNITPTTGKLTVTPITDEVTITVAGNTATKVYNGQAQSVEGFTFTEASSNLISASDVQLAQGATAKAEGTEVGTYNMGLTEGSFTLTGAAASNFTNVKFVVTDGSLTITQAPIANYVTLTTADAAKTYDGTALATGTATASDANGHAVKVEYSVDGTNWTENPADITATNVSDSVTVQVRASVEGTYEGYVTGTQTLAINKRSVTMTSATDSKAYDGTPLTNGTVTEGGDGFVAGQGAAYTVTGSQTVVGTSNNTFSYALNEGTIANNYTITKAEGTLTVSNAKAKFEVTVKAKSATATYDGQEHEAKGVETYTFTVNGKQFKVSGLTTQDPKATNAGEYTNNITGTAVVTDENNNVVTDQFNVKTENGTLTINKRVVTATSVSLEKTYDGSALTNGDNALIYTGSFADGEGITPTFTGSQTAPGSSANAWSYTANAGTDLDTNYTFSKSEGTLKVNAVEKAYDVTVTAASETATYDGQQHSATGMTGTSFTWNGHTYTITGLTSENPTAKDAGTYTNNITGTAVVTDEDGNNVTDQFAVHTVDGKLTIGKRTVSVTSASLTKKYDGSALTNGDNALIYTGSFADGEGITPTFTGSQTAPGSSANAWSYTANAGTDLEKNYTFSKSEGTLTVTNADAKYEVTVTARSAEFTYDGTPKAVSGMTGTEFVWNGQKYTISGLSTQNPKETNAGTYTNNITGTAVVKDAAGNDVTSQFSVKTENGTLTINKASVTVTAKDATKVYGQSDPAFEAEVTGLLGADKGNAEQVIKYTVARSNAGVEAVGTYTGVIVPAGAAEQGNYAVTYVPATFTITPQNINPGTDPENPDPSYSGVEVGTPEDVVYNGTSQQQKPTVTDKAGNALVEGVDYTLSYTEDTTNVGEVTVTVTGKGNYTGTVERTYNITKRTVIVDTGSASKNYDGTTLTAPATVQDATATTGFVGDEGATFTTTTIGPDVSSADNAITKTEWKSNTKESNYTVKTGTIGKLEITAAASENVTCSDPENVVYNGQDQTWAPVVTDTATEATLVAGRDYTVTYSTDDRTNVAGVITVTITGAGNYEGVTFTKTYQIMPKEVTVSTGSDEKVYDGTALTKDEASIEGIVAGETYAIHATGSQTAVGSTSNTYEITWAAEGNTYTAKQSNYTVKTPEALGTLKVTEKSIVPVDPENPDPSDPTKITVNDPSNSVYDGAAHKWTPSLTDPETGATLVEGTDYTVDYSTDNFTDVTGTITVTIKGKGNYTGEFTRTYEITKRDVTVTAASDSKKYDGTALTNDGWTIAAPTETTGMVAGESIASVTVTGSQTYVGTSANTASDAVFADNTKAGNYNVIYAAGSLTVTDGSDVDPVDPKGVVTKTHDAGSYGLGDTVTFTIKAKNIYDEPKTMTFTEQAGVTITGQSTFENVEPGAEVSTTATYTIAEADILAKQFTNTATVSFDGGKSFNGTDTVGTDEIAAKNAHLTVVKTTTNNVDKTRIFNVGETIEYTVTVTNDGNVTINNVTISDELEGVQMVNDTGETTLAPNATRTATYTYTVTQADVDAGKSIVNSATADGIDPDGEKPGVEPGETTDAIPAQKARVTASKEATKSGLSTGEETNYVITITNNGNVTLNNIYVYECKDNVKAQYATDAAGNTISVSNESATPTKYRDYKSIAKLDSSFELAPGESVKVVYEPYTVTEDDVIAGAIRNMAYAGGHYTNAKGKDKTVDVSASNSYYTKADPALSVVKTTTSETPEGGYKAGDTIKYKVTVKNTGNLTVNNITVTDPLVGKTGADAWTIDKLAIGESKDFEATYTVTESDTLAGETITNTAVAKGTAANKEEVTASGSVTDSNAKGEPSIEVAKAVTNKGEGSGTNGAFAAGDTIKYKVTVTNNGNVTLANLKVADALLGKTAENTDWTADELAVGKAVEFTGEYTVTESDIVAGQVVNTAIGTAQAKDDPKQTAEDQSTVTTGNGGKGGDIVESNPHLKVVKETTSKAKAEDGKYVLGETIEYKVTVTNDGNLTLTNVKINDTLDGVQLTSAAGSDTVATLAPGESFEATYSYKVTQADILKGNVHNDATATGNTPDPKKPEPGVTPGSTDDSTESPNGHITVTKEVTNSGTAEEGAFKAGETINYKVTVINDGNLDLTDVVATDELTGNTGENAWNIGDLAVGESKEFTTSYTVTEADTVSTSQSVKNVATATGKSQNGDAGVTPGETESPVEDGKAHMTVTKDTTSKAKAEDGKYALGETIEYEITVTNDGNLTLTDVTVTDELTGNTGENAWTIDTLAPGASQKFTAKYTVTEADVLAGKVHNEATASAENPDPSEPDPTPVDPGTKDDDTKDPVSHLTVTKTTDNQGTAEGGAFKAGETINYTVTVVNDGNQTINDVVVTDQLTGAVLADGESATIGTMAPGATATLHYSYTVTEADTLNGTTITNVATATGTTPENVPDPTVEPGETTDPNEPGSYSINVDKVVTNVGQGSGKDGAFAEGDEIQYQITVTNTGNVTLSNVNTVDELISGNWTEATLAPGATATYTGTHEVTQADIIAKSVTNTAKATGTVQADPTKTVEGEDSVTTGNGGDGGVIVDPYAHLTTVKTTTSTPANGSTYALGETVRYSITVTNDGNLTLTNVHVIDELTGLDENVGTLTPGQSATRATSYQVQQSDIVAGQVHNVATASGTTPDPDNPDPGVTPGEKDDPTDNPNGHATVNKTITNADEATGTDAQGNKVFTTGDTIKYAISITNDGNLDLTDVVVTDDLTGGEWNVGNLAVGATSEVYTTEYKVTEDDIIAGFVKNTATATGKSAAEEDPGFTEGTVTTNTEPENAKVRVVKEATSTPENGEAYVLNEKVTYRVTVTNIGNLTANNVKVTDTLEGVVLTSGSDTIEKLAPGESGEVTYEYTITEADVIAGKVNNVATAEGTTPDPDNPIPPTPGSEEVDTEGNKAHVTVAKETTNAPANGTAYVTGETITYQITVTNDGNLTVKNVVVTDELTGDEWTIDSLAIGATQTYTASHEVTASEAAAGSVTNVATATGTTDDPTKPGVDTTPGEVTDDTTPAPVVPGPSVPEPINTIVTVLENAAAPVVNVFEPAPDAEQIDDEGTPLAGFDTEFCWVHYYIILGIIITLVYSVAVVGRRANYSRKLKGYENDTLGKDEQPVGETASTQPAMATGQED